MHSQFLSFPSSTIVWFDLKFVIHINRTIKYIFLCLVYFIQYYASKIHSCCYEKQYFILCYCCFLLYWTHYHNLSIHFIIGGNWACFQFLALTNNAENSFTCLLRYVCKHFSRGYPVIRIAILQGVYIFSFREYYLTDF